MSDDGEQLVQIPFTEPGMTEAVDPTVLAPPRLRAVNGGRFRRGGRISKSFGYTAISTTVTGTSRALSQSTIPHAVGEYRGNQLLVSGGLVYARSSVTSPWTQSDRVSLFTPRRVDTTGANQTDGLVSHNTCATIPGYVVVAWYNGTSAAVSYRVMDEAGVLLLSGTVASADKPRLASSSGVVTLFYRDTTGGGLNVRARNITPSTLVVSGSTIVGVLNTNADFIDAAPYDTGEVLFAYRDAGASITVKRITVATLATAASRAVAGGLYNMCVFGTPGESICLATVSVAGPGSVFATILNNALTVTTAGPTLIETDAANIDQPGISRQGTNTYHIFWSGRDNTGALAYPRIRHCTYNTAATVGTIYTIFNVRAASRPYDSDANRIRIWVHTGDVVNGFGRYALLTMEGGGPYFNQIELYSQPGAGAGSGGIGDSYCPPVLQLTSDFAVPFLPYPTSRRGIDLYRYYASSQNAMLAHRQAIETDQATHITGGSLVEHTGGIPGVFAGCENGFLHSPGLAATLAAGGALTAGALYQYVAVFEYIDPQTGRRHRSAPGNIVSITTSGGNQTGSLTFSRLGVSGRLASVSTVAALCVHVYRTLANGSQFQRITSYTAAPSADGSAAATNTYTDTASDASISSNEFLYVLGGVFQNDMAPSHQFAVSGGGRMFVGGQFTENIVSASKLIVPGEPVQFVEDDAFRIIIPEPVTGLGWMDGSPVIFSASGIYVPDGDGPNDQGQPAYGVPRRLPTDVGCTNWRTVREVPAGILFQSLRGFYLLPRGFSAPVFIGEAVEETTASFSYCYGVAKSTRPVQGEANKAESTLSFMMGTSETSGATRLLTYDAQGSFWHSVDTILATDACGNWGKSCAFLTRNPSFAYYDGNGDWVSYDGASGGATAFRETHIRTGDIRPFGFLGWGRVRGIQFFGEFRAVAALNVRATVDGGVLTETTTALAISAVNGQALTAGMHWYAEWSPQFMQCNSLDLEIWDSVNGVANSEGLAFTSVALLVEGEQGMKRLNITLRTV